MRSGGDQVVSDPAVAEKLDEERRLIAEAQAGNLDAMRPLFEAYAAPLYATVLLPRLGDAATAEDVLRDTFVQAIQKLAQFRWTGRSIYAWLRQIAIHKAYDVHRRTKRTGALIESLRHEQPSATGRGDQADAILIAAEEMTDNRRRIDEALGGLNPRYRRAIELRLIEERPREACATTLGVTTSTFDVLLFRAVRAFRVRFGARDGEAVELAPAARRRASTGGAR
jgi:RNA polymerase sigma-70 factor (ECF subfamily)